VRVPALHLKYLEMSFNKLLESWNWKPIRNCPGRYILCGPEAGLQRPAALIGDEVEVGVYQTDAADDTVMVAALAGGGLISYQKPDGSFVHTLNTPGGFQRKLRQLGIDVPSPKFSVMS
jgi:hypothetical protein